MSSLTTHRYAFSYIYIYMICLYMYMYRYMYMYMYVYVYMCRYIYIHQTRKHDLGETGSDGGAKRSESVVGRQGGLHQAAPLVTCAHHVPRSWHANRPALRGFVYINES